MVRLETKFGAADSLTPEIAAKLAHRASHYQASVSLVYGGRVLRLDSLIGILSVQMLRGSVLTVMAEGLDEKVAAADIRNMIAGT